VEQKSYAQALCAEAVLGKGNIMGRRRLRCLNRNKNPLIPENSSQEESQFNNFLDNCHRFWTGSISRIRIFIGLFINNRGNNTPKDIAVKRIWRSTSKALSSQDIARSVPMSS
jgi:hypothetical protein